MDWGAGVGVGLERIELSREPDFALGPVTIRPSLSRLEGSASLRVQPQVMRVLVALARRPGGVVTREELVEACWAGGIVSDETLGRCVSRLRAALTEAGALDTRIEPVSRSGYRLVPPEPAGDPILLEPAPADDAPGPVPQRRRRLPLLLLAAASFALAGAAFLMREAPEGWEAGEVRALTLGDHAESDPALSPDGTAVVFTRIMPGDSQDLFLRPTDGGPEISLTAGPGIKVAPSWSPDGKRLAYIHSDGEGPCSVHVMDMPSGIGREVAPCIGAMFTSLAWTADGTGLIMSAAEPGGPPRLVLRSLADGTSRPLTSPPNSGFGDHFATVSPDGGRLAFARRSAPGAFALMLLDLETGAERALTDDAARLIDIAWAPDGRGLFVSLQMEGDTGIWWFAAEGGGRRRLFPGLQALGYLGVAAQAPVMVLESRVDRSSLVRLDPVTGAETVLTDSGRLDRHPAAGPGGRIAFVSDRSGTAELWLREPDGATRQLTRLGSTFLIDPRWSPDGARIAFAASVGGNVDIHMLELGTGRVERVATTPDMEDGPGFSADGRTLYFVSHGRKGSQVYGKKLYTGDSSLYPVMPAAGFAESPDGRWHYAVSPDARRLTRRPAGGGEAETLFDAGGSLIADMALGPDGPILLLRDGGITRGGRLVRVGPGGVSLLLPGAASARYGFTLADGAIVVTRDETPEIRLHAVRFEPAR